MLKILQIENEFGNVEHPYGEAGKVYMNWAANMAVSLDTGSPWIMCQQKDAPPIVVSIYCMLSLIILIVILLYFILLLLLY